MSNIYAALWNNLPRVKYISSFDSSGQDHPSPGSDSGWNDGDLT